MRGTSVPQGVTKGCSGDCSVKFFSFLSYYESLIEQAVYAQSETLMKHLLTHLQESGHTASDNPLLAVSTIRAENESSLSYLHLGFFNLI